MSVTKQVRNIMRDFNRSVIYTNKVKDETRRHVKCYAPAELDRANALITALEKVPGVESVFGYNNFGPFFSPRTSIIVRCVVA